MSIKNQQNNFYVEKNPLKIELARMTKTPKKMFRPLKMICVFLWPSFSPSSTSMDIETKN